MSTGRCLNFYHFLISSNHSFFQVFRRQHKRRHVSQPGPVLKRNPLNRCWQIIPHFLLWACSGTVLHIPQSELDSVRKHPALHILLSHVSVFDVKCISKSFFCVCVCATFTSLMVSHISQSVFKKPLEIMIITSVIRYEIRDVDHKFHHL